MPSIQTPFRINSSGSVAAVSTPERIIEQKIIDVLTTNRFERVMRPEYGAGAYQLLFEPVDELIYGEFRTDALDEVNRNVSSAAISDIIVAPATQPYFNDEPASTIEITVRYLLRPQGVRSFTFQITDTSLINEETPI